MRLFGPVPKFIIQNSVKDCYKIESNLNFDLSFLDVEIEKDVKCSVLQEMQQHDSTVIFAIKPKTNAN